MQPSGLQAVRTNLSDLDTRSPSSNLFACDEDIIDCSHVNLSKLRHTVNIDVIGFCLGIVALRSVIGLKELFRIARSHGRDE